MVEGVDYCIDASGDGRTVWVNAADGSCIGRFSKRFGIDVHRTAEAQREGANECLYCTHVPAGQEAWEEFRKRIKQHYDIDVPANLITWP